MHNEEKEEITVEKPNVFWHRVYFAVVVTTIVIITALWAFSQHFS